DTVLNHFVKCEEEGKDINWEEFVDSEKEKEIMDAIETVGREFLKPIKEKVSDTISYYDIKTVLYKENYKK
ncbi:MAG: helix-turn-helix domain-containing protein, partial [Senegalia sp. (in: firmicutes)]